MLQSACLEINPITFHNFAAQFNCTSIDLVSAYLMVLILIVLASEYFVGGLIYWGSSDDLPLHPISSFVIWHTRHLHLSHDTLYL